MQIIDNTNYKFERKFTDCDTYQVKITTELLEELENCQNVTEIELNIKGSSGTLTIPSSKSKKSKVFDLNIGSISRGEKESFELNAFRLNKRVESLGSLQVRLNVQATSKVYDMTKKKISEVEDESKKHCVKELKLEKFPNKQRLAYKVMKNKEARKSEVNLSNSQGTFVNSNSNDRPIEKEFTIRQKILHLLGVKPLTKDALLLRLQRLNVTSSDRQEVDRYLSQLSTLNRENMYQLSNQFIPELREDWSYYNDEEKRKVAKLKSDSRSNISNRIPVSKHSTQPPVSPDSHENTRPKAPLAPHPSRTKIAALDMMAKGVNIGEVSKTLNVPENLISSWKSQEFQIRQNYENGKRSNDFIPQNAQQKENTVSPVNVTRLNLPSSNANEMSAYKSHRPFDETFVDSDKQSSRMALVNGNNSNNKRRLEHSDKSHSTDQPGTKKVHLSHNDTQSSSSCEVTPKSDISHASISSLQTKPKSDKSKEFPSQKSNPKTLSETQKQFNAAFEEYSKLCERLKDCETKIETLRLKCKNGSEDYGIIYGHAKRLLADMESPRFKTLTNRVKALEAEMFEFLKLLNSSSV